MGRAGTRTGNPNPNPNPRGTRYDPPGMEPLSHRGEKKNRRSPASPIRGGRGPIGAHPGAI